MLVSNIGQSPTTILDLRNSQFQGRGFTTGDNPTGYALESIEVQASNALGFNVTAMWANIHSGSPGNPGPVLHTLTNPTMFSTALAFTAPVGTKLAANTDYFVTFGCSSNNCVRFVGTSSGAENSGAASGWSIHNLGITSFNAGGSWQTQTFGIRIRINGSEHPPLVLTPVSGGLRADWVLPSDSAVSYYVRWERPGQPSPKLSGMTGITGNSYTITHENPVLKTPMLWLTYYTVRVGAVDSEGNEIPDSSAEATSLIGPALTVDRIWSSGAFTTFPYVGTNYWRYRTPQGSCVQGGPTSRPIPLTGLKRNTTYTWKAYSGLCTKELASVTFTTEDTGPPALTVPQVNISETGARVKLSNFFHEPWYYRRTSPGPRGSCTEVDNDDDTIFFSGLTPGTNYSLTA